MARAKVHHGARVDLLPVDGEARCPAQLPVSTSAMMSRAARQCVYRAGHDGPHFAGWEFWPNPDGARKPDATSQG